MTQRRSQRGKQRLMQLLFGSGGQSRLIFLAAMAAGSAGVRWSLTGKQSARCGTMHPPE